MILPSSNLNLSCAATGANHLTASQPCTPIHVRIVQNGNRLVTRALVFRTDTRRTAADAAFRQAGA